MRAPIRDLYDWAKCVGTPPGRGAHAVLQRFRCGSSRDDQIPVEPGHGLSQRHAVEHAAPERIAIRTSPQLRKPTAKEEGKAFAAIIKPVPPAPYGSPINTTTATTTVQRAPAEQQHQHHLLNGPVVPAPRRDARRQPRARAQTFPAKETQNRNRIERLAAGAAIGLAVIAAMSPQPTQAAVRARIRAVGFRVRREGFNVLNEGGDARYNSVHRPVFFVFVLDSQTHDNKGVLAYLVCASSQATKGPVLTNAPESPGSSGYRRTLNFDGRNNRPVDTWKPGAPTRQSRSNHRLDTGLRYGEFRAGVQAAARCHQWVHRLDHRCLRPGGRSTCAQRGGPCGVALQHSGGNRG